jgi:hypothetical protein
MGTESDLARTDAASGYVDTGNAVTQFSNVGNDVFHSLLRACSFPNTVRFTLCFIGICVFLAMPRVVTDRVQIEPLNFCSGPVRFSKKFQTAVDARLAGKTIDVDAVTQALPTVLIDQVLEDRFQRDAV